MVVPSLYKKDSHRATFSAPKCMIPGGFSFLVLRVKIKVRPAEQLSKHSHTVVSGVSVKPHPVIPIPGDKIQNTPLQPAYHMRDESRGFRPSWSRWLILT